MPDEDKNLEALRLEVDRAVKAFVAYTADSREHENAYTIGWSAYAEYTTVEFQQNDYSGNVCIVPEGQPAATSRGLFEFGADAFGRGRG